MSFGGGGSHTFSLDELGPCEALPFVYPPPWNEAQIILVAARHPFPFRWPRGSTASHRASSRPSPLHFVRRAEEFCWPDKCSDRLYVPLPHMLLARVAEYLVVSIVRGGVIMNWISH